ncbi:MAG: hypothetical protein NTY53_15600 [Kiritimatiellaeota bacterium]|nr:hypothetical protein [Kiritimatiellota bacterium]
MEQEPPKPATPSSRYSGLALASLGLDGMDWALVEVCGLAALVILAIIIRQVLLSKAKKSAGVTTERNWFMDGSFIGLLLVVSVLLALLFPVSSMSLYKGRMTSTLSFGRSFFRARFGSGMIGEPIGWPKSIEFPTSTAFFTNTVYRGDLKVDYSFFSAQGITPYKGTNAASFKAENNAWCVVADINEGNTDKIPVLFTRNLHVSSLADLKGKVGDQLSDDPPFGRKGVPVIFNGGSGTILKPDMLWSDVLGGATFTNRVLRP